MASNTIELIGRFRREEDTAGGPITPGHLIELFNSAGARRLRVHQTEGGFAERAIAIEDPLQGNTATSVESRTIDDDYVTTEKVQYVLAEPGAVANMFLFAGENVVLGTQLISNGDGTLIALASLSTPTVAVEQIIGIAEEALDLSASGAADTRLPVRLL